MIDRYLFRGKNLELGKWVFGNYIYHEHWENHFIEYVDSRPPEPVIIREKVDPKTVGQCTGLKDKNGNFIYEKDILRSGDGRGVSFVVHSLDRWRFNSWMPASMGLYDHVNPTNGKEMAEIIGNIHDNPELMEVEE